MKKLDELTRKIARRETVWENPDGTKTKQTDEGIEEISESKKREWDMWDGLSPMCSVSARRKRLEKVIRKAEDDDTIGNFAYSKRPIAKLYRDEMEGDI